MAVTIAGHYLGGLKTELVHEPSGARLITAAPVDNQGDGSSFSPTDMVAASLGAIYPTALAQATKAYFIREFWPLIAPGPAISA